MSDLDQPFNPNHSATETHYVPATSRSGSTNEVLPPQPTNVGGNVHQHSMFGSDRLKQWKIACTITSIVVTILGGILTLHHFIAMIVWYAKGVNIFGTSNLFLIPMNIIVLLIGVAGVIGVTKSHLEALRAHAYGCVFGSIFFFFVYMIHQLPSWFSGSANSSLYYDGAISLVFYVLNIPIGIIVSVVAQVYMRCLENALNKKTNVQSGMNNF
ncbi:hypothetical protein C9374_013996 [Naegleria lovaniensis]|uniref:Transmembrane protein n=1 Tax=Naegleria lovaniensis TaxID=51637 RepID=A0AA88H0H7_NAELO|nr:uncharacterized protein C9374_013996 [Naegleria lovaniensis]KAG2389436.1 hypothetical protein C9374_013996 [Naegleria lovaniensis]